MKKIFPIIILFHLCYNLSAQNKSAVKEYKKVFTTYPYSDASSIPDPLGKIYPYFRYDGFTTIPEQKEWQVVELENEYIKVTILPEVGGKVWSASEKKSGKDFLYNNHVVKFRDVAMRGPWTSGGIEANYGIIGHTPNCATPVDYITLQKPDGSASCIIGVLDLLTQTQWRLEVNLPSDKAYFTTESTWYNTSLLEQPYYTWMNTGIKANGNLEFIYPGNHHLGHEGEYGEWPIDKRTGRNISFYDQNNFGGYKSYHVFGVYTDFFGGYWHDDDYGMARYARRDDKAGKKIWIWGLSQQGMIWEKLLTDKDGQYVEVQSGRLFNQSVEKSMYSPFKFREFAANETDKWTEYWFPVMQTKGFVKANEWGALNTKTENGWLKFYFCPIQGINEEFRVHKSSGDYFKKLNLQPLQTFSDSIRLEASDTSWKITIRSKMEFDSKGFTEAALSRPIASPPDFDWDGIYGLYLAGKSYIEQRKYPEAEEKINGCLKKDKNYLPALAALSELEYRRLNYSGAFEAASKALAINTYDAASNYYYGLAALKLNKTFDAKDGFDLATQSAEFRVAAFNRLSEIYFKEKQFDKAEDCAKKSLIYNHQNIDGLQLLALIYRKMKNDNAYEESLKAIRDMDPLNHFVSFENYFVHQNDNTKKAFLSAIRNELPSETCLELATWYYRIGLNEETKALLSITPAGVEAGIWKRYFTIKENDAGDVPTRSAYPFREETAEILSKLIESNKDWNLKYSLALIYHSRRNLDKAKRLFLDCGDEANDPSFYAVRASLIPEHAEKDLVHAISLDKGQWRFPKLLAEYYLKNNEPPKALSVAGDFYKNHPTNFIMGMLYAKTLLLNQKYKECDILLSKLNIIPFEGATEGRQLYREAKLMMAVQALRNNDHKKAIQFVQAAKLWPENLGEGKPYDADIDERLENWLLYMAYSHLHKTTDAETALKKIIDFIPGPEITSTNIYPANALVTAWAMEKSGQTDKAKAWLKDEMTRYPGDKILMWVIDTFDKNQTASKAQDPTIRILEKLMEVEQK